MAFPRSTFGLLTPGMLLAGFVWACSGTTGQTLDAGVTGGTGSGGVTSGGGGVTSGGVTSGSGAVAAGGAASGGNQNGSGSQDGSGGHDVFSSGGDTSSGGSTTGTGGGPLGVNECTDAHPCGALSECYAPGTPSPDICGAPNWCGQCACPLMPDVAVGSGQFCSDQMLCIDGASASYEVADLCDPELNRCGTCISDEHCPSELPFCGFEAYSQGKACFECAQDSDCPSEVPVCDKLQSQYGESTGGTCKQCRKSGDCAQGICSSMGACIAECTSDDACGPNRTCNAEQRCAARPCQESADCSPQSECVDQTCRARTCSADAECGPTGYCVFGSCYATPGRCEYTAVP